MTPSPQKDNRRMAFWKTRWKQHLNGSLLRQTQKKTPEQWQRFYNRVAGIWSDIAGISAKTATALAGHLMQEQMIRQGGTVLDIGCGPGTLSMALAEQDMQVTALDRSQGMIQVVKQKLSDRRDLRVHPMTGDWRALPDTPVHGTAIAAFFPEVCSPDGILHMETLAAETCILIMGDGTDTFSLRRQIWDRLMPVPCPASGFHHVCAAGYLTAAGRAPRVSRLSVPATLDVDEAAANAFFHAYFSMFGVSEKDLVSAIQKALFPCLKQGRVCLQGTAHLIIVGWHPCSSPIRDSSPC
ncbi:MAG: methyltransferase domain-containing protein [Desulfotignum sp.]